MDDLTRRQEPYWVWACPICGRQLRDSTSTCCDGSFGKTIYLVPADQLAGAVGALERFGGHVSDCRSTRAGVGGPCDCGYDAALHRLGGQS